MAKNISPQVPGDLDKSDHEAGDQAAGETVTVSKSDLDALMARIKAAEAAATPRASLPPLPKSNLPDAAEIDVSALNRAVLTTTGWLVPPAIAKIAGQRD